MTLTRTVLCLLGQHELTPTYDAPFAKHAECDHCNYTETNAQWTEFDEFNDWVTTNELTKNNPSLPSPDHLTPARTRQ